MLTVLSGPRVRQKFSSDLGQAESIIEFPKVKEARLGGDLGTMEFQFEATVETQS